MQRAGFDPASHSGKALVNVLETYPRDELFQIDEDTLYRVRAGDPAARRAPARARAGAARPLRPLRLGARLRAARALRLPGARADRRLSRRGLQGPRQRLSIRTSRKAPLARVHFIIGRSGGETPNPDRADAGASGPRHRADLDRRARRRARGGLRARPGARAARALPRRFLRRLSRGLSAAVRSTTSAIIEACRPSGRSASISIARSDDGKPCVGLKVWSHGRPIPLSERVPVLENMGFRVVDERTYRVVRRARRRLAARHGAGARRRRPASWTAQGGAGGGLHRGDARPGRERRL